MLASGAEVQWFAHGPLVHLSNHLPAMALRQPPFAGQFFELFPFIGEFERQFPVSCFCAPFELPNPSVASDSVETGDPERTLGRLMRVFSD